MVLPGILGMEQINLRLVNLKRTIVVLAGAKTQTGQNVKGCGNYLWISSLRMILCNNGQFRRVARLISRQNDTWHLNATKSCCTQIRWGTSSPHQTSSSVKRSRKTTMIRFRSSSTLQTEFSRFCEMKYLLEKETHKKKKTLGKSSMRFF